MNTTLATWMKLAVTATVISYLVWNVLVGEMSSITNAIASLMNGGATP